MAATYDYTFHSDLVDVLLASTYKFPGEHMPGEMDGLARRIGVMLLLYASALAYKWDEAERSVRASPAFQTDMDGLARRTVIASTQRLPPSRIWDARMALADQLVLAHKVIVAERVATREKDKAAAEARGEMGILYLLPPSSYEACADLSWAAATCVAEQGIPFLLPALKAHISELTDKGPPPKGKSVDLVKANLVVSMAEHILTQLRDVGTRRIAEATADAMVKNDPQGALHAIRVMGAVDAITLDGELSNVSVNLLPSLHSSVMPDPTEARNSFIACVQTALHDAFRDRTKAYTHPRSSAVTIAQSIVVGANNAAKQLTPT
jgi:hypothetical protein